MPGGAVGLLSENRKRKKKKKYNRIIFLQRRETNFQTDYCNYILKKLTENEHKLRKNCNIRLVYRLVFGEIFLRFFCEPFKGFYSTKRL